MMHGARKIFVVALLASLLAPAVARAQGADPLYLEAKRLFDALDYENAVRALDQSIASLLARPPQDATRRELLPAVYEMRGRSKFGLGDQVGAKADFVSLLKASPGYSLTGQVSPRVVTLFDDTVKETVTSMRLSVTPATAKLEIDGAPVAVGNAVPIAIGDHVITADQTAYRHVQQPVTAEVGKILEVAITLDRVASLLNILTVPPDVDIVIDGIRRGKTTAGPLVSGAADASRPGTGAAPVSAAMVISDLQPGPHVIEFTRACYVREERRLAIDKPDDYVVGPIALTPSIASLSVRANETGAQVFVDGQARGGTPFALADLCEGEHVVEVRSPAGRYLKRVSARTGDRINVEGTIKPALALLSVTGQPQASPDLRLAVERALDPAQGATVFAPPLDQAAQALKANQVADGWLAFDANKRPLGTDAELAQPMRREMSTKLAAAFGAQGVAAVTLVDRNRVVVSLLAAGSGQPDVLAISLDSPESIAAAVAQLDRAPSFFKPSIGLVSIDIADSQGATVLRVDANGPAAKAGVRAGDVVATANGRPIADTAALTALLAATKADDNVKLELKDRTGAAKTVDVKVSMSPRLIGVSDQTLLGNRMLLALRAQLLAQHDPAEEAVLRLNLAAALAHVEAWSDARAELQRVKLPDGPDVSNGTVQYLLALCADKLGNRADAEAALKAAAASEGLLTEDGPAVKDLAEARLAELQRSNR